jgi:hypothetical protein
MHTPSELAHNQHQGTHTHRRRGHHFSQLPLRDLGGHVLPCYPRIFTCGSSSLAVSRQRGIGADPAQVHKREGLCPARARVTKRAWVSWRSCRCLAVHPRALILSFLLLTPCADCRLPGPRTRLPSFISPHLVRWLEPQEQPLLFATPRQPRVLPRPRPTNSQLLRSRPTTRKQVERSESDS